MIFPRVTTCQVCCVSFSFNRPNSRGIVRILGFYPSSQFAVHKKIVESVRPIAFPEPMLMSRNLYDPKWTMATFRRLKNIICVLEYAPNRDQLKPVRVFVSRPPLLEN